MNIDIVEFVEKVTGLELLEYQKQLLRNMQKMKDEKVQIINTRQGYMLVVPKEEHEKVMHNCQNGLRTNVTIVDELSEWKRELNAK